MRLRSGDSIDIIAPSFAPKNNQWKKGVEILKDWGLKPRFPKEFLSPHFLHSHSDQKRSFFLNQAFSNKNSSAVWLLRGGYGLQKLMPSFIKQKEKGKFKKKLFIGYSDGTPLHLYLNARKQKTLHAPVLSELPLLSQARFSELKNILFGKKTSITFSNLSVVQKIPKKTLKGKITGGNLSLLSSSVGTPCFPSFNSHFLFIEDVGEEAYRVDRLLYHLFYSGALKACKALLFGFFPPLNQSSLKEILKNFSKICPLPMIFNLPCGHLSSSRFLPFQTSSELIIKNSKAELQIFTDN